MIEEIVHVSFCLNLESGNQAVVDAPRPEICRILKGVIEKLENDEESSVILDINGNNSGSWDLEIETKEWPDRDETLALFEGDIEENGFISNKSKVYSIREAAELDYDGLNEKWNSFIDMKMTEGDLPSESSAWDWEN